MPRYLIVCHVIFVVGTAITLLLADSGLGFLYVAWGMGWILIGDLRLNKWPAPGRSKNHQTLVMLWLWALAFCVYFGLRIAIGIWRK